MVGAPGQRKELAGKGEHPGAFCPPRLQGSLHVLGPEKAGVMQIPRALCRAATVLTVNAGHSR